LVIVAGAFASLVGYGSAAHADAAAGKATFTAACAECHEVVDFEGEDAAELQGTLKKIVAGTQKHKKALKLTDAQIADVAAYMASGK
jgi:mono/diheme cytochrome c family protein